MIALIPLDNRPCNTRFPRQIAALGGTQLIEPNDSTLGFFSAPADCDSFVAWLHDLPAVEALIVSVDMLAYGGLVASRRPLVSTQQALERLSVLKDWRESRPGVPIYGFNILMRLAITMDGDAAVAHYYNIMRYARLADEARRFNSAHLRGELEKVTREIPTPVLESYLAARRRNHDINLSMIEWLSQGVFDYLLITQEDATEWGLHRREQDHLLAHRDALGVNDKMSLHPGADEAALTLLARHWNTGVSWCARPSDEADYERIAPFEDRPYHLALQQHVAAGKGHLVESQGENPAASTCSEENTDFQLFINAPVGGSQKDESAEARDERRTRIGGWLDTLENALRNDERVALCDVAFPNGGDNLLLTELDKRKLLGKLTIYAGWNTAGNTTGTVLAQGAALKRWETLGESWDVEAREKSLRLQRQFVFERLVDDWFYQAKVRAGVERAARDLGVSPLKMNEDDNAPVETQTRRELSHFAQLLARRHFDVPLEKCDIVLPWRRTFEVDFRARLDGNGNGAAHIAANERVAVEV